MNTAGKPLSVLLADDIQAMSAAAWMPPVVDGPRPGRRQRPTLGELEEVEKIAWDEAYAKGHAAGLANGEKEIQQRINTLEQRSKQFDAVLNAFVEPVKQLDEEIESQLVSLAIAIARHLVRRELRTDPSQIIAVVREAVGLLPLAQRNVRVHLHPQDATLVRELLAQPQYETAWTVVEDPVMTRGGCRVSTDVSQVDARLETRLAVVLKHLLSDDRRDRRNELSDDGEEDAGVPS
ncbi:MAG: FliH/SctL family protein [Steroidobacteraceae bacterium]